ncbi:MAG TPA: AAA family ATPase [Sphingomicrobium sp.]|nr:AAA family ATPase [Sphingomicrobium sp.]
MTAPVNEQPRTRSWKAGALEKVALVLSSEQSIAASWLADAIADPALELRLAPIDGAHNPADLPPRTLAAVVEVSASNKQSVENFSAFAASQVPVIAAAYDPPLAFVRQLVRLGAHDVLPLPIERADLDTALDPIRAARRRDTAGSKAANGKVVAIVKSDGGVGATALLGQVAQRFASEERARGRETCLIDLDLQFGDAAFQLGLQPSLSMADVIAGRARIDGAMLRTIAAGHSSGLNVISAPLEILPLDTLDSDQLMHFIGEAKSEFGTVFVDLPSNWTNWSLSLLASADLVLMVTQLSIPSLHRARRQLDLVLQHLGRVPLQLIVNRFEKKLFAKLDAGDVATVLGREPDYLVANDYEAVSEAIDRGVPIAEIRRKGAITRDLAALEAGVAAALGRER